MLTIAIDRGDQLRKGHAALSFKLFQKSSSRLTLVLWPAMTIERFETGDFTTSPPRISHRYYMTVWLFGQENHPAWCRRGSGYRGIGNGVHNRDPISASRSSLRCSMMLDVAAMT
jgi:hypothetical protein